MRTVLQGGRPKAYRPLPRGEIDAAVRAGLAAYERGDFFEAHELLEPAWMGTDDPVERELYQGLIKLAAGGVHRVRGNGLGMAKNLRGARDRLERARAGMETGGIRTGGTGATGLGAVRLDLTTVIASVDLALLDLERGLPPDRVATVPLAEPFPCIDLSRQELLDQRREGVTEELHFPETLASRVIDLFSSVGDLVLDPFAGFGTTAVVAVRMGRRAVAVELLPERAAIIRGRLGDTGLVVVGDARELSTLVRGPVDLCLTSPPYMTRTGHPENPLTGYRTLDGAYETYLDEIESVARQVGSLLRPGGHLVLNAATIVSEAGATPLARDIGERVARHLVRLPDLSICWDEPPPGLLDDRCLVFQKTGG